MPSGTISNVIGVILQYFFLIIIYVFLAKVVKAIYQDLRTDNNNRQNSPSSIRREIKNNQIAELFVIEKGKLAMNNRYEVGETITIGRGNSNGVIINDSFVSHEHACITRYKDGFWLVDLNSTNGTCLNGQRIAKETKLSSGDIIKIGEVTFKFVG